MTLARLAASDADPEGADTVPTDCPRTEANPPGTLLQEPASAQHPELAKQSGRQAEWGFAPLGLKDGISNQSVGPSHALSRIGTSFNRGC